MNKQELAEIRRRFNPDKNNIDWIRGCYVNEKKEIVSTFSHPLLSLPQEEAEKYLAIFKRTLSGIQGKNLVDIVFRPDQVMEGEAHQLLTSLVKTALKVDPAVEKFFNAVIENLEFEGNYLILLMHDTYDVPFKGMDENKVDQISEDVFEYMLCSICPVKLTRPALCYCAEDNAFHDREADLVVAGPELGFMFPTFDDRMTNIYNALYFTRDTAENHDEFVNAIFDNRAPMPAAAQKETFEMLLSDALEEDCSLEVVQTVHEQIREKVEEIKADKSADAPTISMREVSQMLQECGVREEKVQAFEEKYNEEFGMAMDLSAQNIVDVKKFELKTPDVVVKVNPERSDLVQTRVIDGLRYILIRADDGVEVNGVNIAIGDENLDEDDAPF